MKPEIKPTLSNVCICQFQTGRGTRNLKTQFQDQIENTHSFLSPLYKNYTQLSKCQKTQKKNKQITAFQVFDIQFRGWAKIRRY